MADSKSKKTDKGLSIAELTTKRNDLKKKYMDLRFQAIVGHVDNPMQKRTMRREIARLNTLIRQHELAEAKKAVEAALNK
jgi:large subunit ribosomal protein L29